MVGLKGGSMTKREKIALVNDLSVSLSDSNIIICSYKGLNARELDELRASVRSINSNVKVIKNKLADIAFSNAKINGIVLKDTNIFIWGKDQISLSRSVQNFSDSNKEKFSIKVGYFDGKIVDSKYVETVSKLPNKEELIAILLSLWMSPLRYFITGIDNLRKEKEK